MNKNHINKLEEKLKKEKIEASNMVKSLEENIKNNFNDSVVEMASIDNHPGDVGSEVYQKELEITLSQSQREIEEKLSNALNNIENGTYGVCEKCKKKIEDERLEMISYTTLCANCAKEKTSANEMETNNSPVNEYGSENLEEFNKGFFERYEDMLETSTFNGESGYNDYDLESLNKEKRINEIDGSNIEEISNSQYKSQF